MTDPKALAETLDDLLSRCASGPVAEITRDGTAITPGSLPGKLEQFLSEYIAHPEYSAEANIVMSAVMQDFGTRVFRRFFLAGLNQKDCDTDLAQNRYDLLAARGLLTALAAECANTPFIPQATTRLLSRIAN